MANSDILGSIQQALIWEWQYRSLEFLKYPCSLLQITSSSSTNNCFQKQFLACYWALVEAECLTMGHQVTMQPELPIMNCIPSHKAWAWAVAICYQINMVYKRSSLPRSIISCMSRWLRLLQHQFLLHCLLHLNLCLCPPRESLMTRWLKKKKLEPISQISLHNMLVLPQSGQPYSKVTLKEGSEGKSF